MAAFKTVQLPAKGSSTAPRLTPEASRQRSTSWAGNAAGCVRPGTDFASIIQTSSSSACSKADRLNLYRVVFLRTGIQTHTYAQGRSKTFASGSGRSRCQIIRYSAMSIQSRSSLWQYATRVGQAAISLGNPGRWHLRREELPSSLRYACCLFRVAGPCRNSKYRRG